jgi:hypothetical protein
MGGLIGPVLAVSPVLESDSIFGVRWFPSGGWVVQYSVVLSRVVACQTRFGLFDGDVESADPHYRGVDYG